MEIIDQQKQEYSSLEPGLSFSDDLRRYLGLLWHWAWLIVLFTVLGGVVGYFISSRETPVYRASATMLINESRTINEYANILASERLAQTYSQLMIQAPVLEGVIDRLGLDMDVARLKGGVSVSVVEETQLMVVSVENEDPVRAAQIANSIGTVFAEQNAEIQSDRYRESKESLSAQLQQVDGQINGVNDQITALESEFQEVVDSAGNLTVVVTLEQQRDRDRLEANLALYQQIYANLLQSFEQVRLAEIQSTSSVRLVEPARPPNRPIRPNVVQDTVLGVSLGLLLGIGLIFLIEALDDSVKGPRDITRQLQLPVIGFIARMERENSGPVAAVKPRSPVTEAFRSLRTNIQYASVDRPLKTLLVTSPSPKDGKSTVAINLATVIAQSGRNVALIDGDLRRPTLHKRLNLSNRMGLSDLFVQTDIYLDGALRKTRVPNLYLVSSGGLPPNPAELVGSEKMSLILSRLHEVVDIVLIDSPPVMAVTDATIMASKADGVLLVVRPGETKLGPSKQTIDQLRRSGARILGVVMNRVEGSRSRYYYYRGYFQYQTYYYYGEPVKKKKNKRALRRKKNTQADAAG